jgi:hypothetical protein
MSCPLRFCRVCCDPLLTRSLEVYYSELVANDARAELSKGVRYR